MGKPVITSGIGDLPETVLAPPRVAAEDRTGWLINPSDPIELARAVAAALALDGAVRQAIGARSRRRAENRFSPARVAEAILAIYASLLERGSQDRVHCSGALENRLCPAFGSNAPSTFI